MAASSSSPSSGVHCKYDVFLSFRGEDTRKNFVCHLYRALEQKAIHTFIDSEELEKGNQISELLNAVAESSISVVVLSQNYASSTWCLKELVKIMECKDKKQQIVVPIFYEVDPSDIRKLKKEFGKAFAKHEENPNLDKEILETWKTAVKGITDLSGWDSRQYKDDIELIEKIIGDIFEKRSHIPGPSSLANNLVGMDHHIEEVSLRLCRGKNDVGVVGIWGMGGIGKTTIARAAYDKIAHQFEHKCFFYNVKERFPKKDEAQMRGELLSMILNEQSVDIFNQGSNAMLERLGKKKVLVVLDDVETFSQIEALLGNFYSFGVGSRILVTTRDKESLAGVYETYEPRCLKPNESLELFMKHAFRNNQPSKEYSDLSKRAIEYAQGLPLALKVLGGSLYNKSIPQWEELLEKIKKIPERKIMDVLRTSLEGLDDQEKNIFLDITCLFRGWNTDFVTEILDSCGFYPRNGLRVLVDRALITYRFWMLDMHDLLQEMGREIVRLESTIEPGKRSRLWSYEDVNRVLTQNTATDAVECLVLDLWDSKVDLCINTGAFVRMTKLRLLIIYYSFDTIFDYKDFDDEDYYDCGDICPVDGCKQLSRGDFEFLSQELRLLLWHGCPLESLPSTFIPKNLVQLDMRASHIRELWEGIKPLQNLKAIKLSHCQYLVKIPDLSEAVNLEKLLLDGCSSLFEVHSSISALQNVHLLDLNRCKKLKILPSCIHMKSLWTLKLSGCSNLEKFPEIADVMTELEELYLNETAVKELPSSIDQLLAIKKLTMRNCESLEFLPDSICNLANLTHLDLTGCTELKTLSTSIHMPSLRTLNLNGCSNLEKFPEISGTMKELPELCLDGTAIKGLPSLIDLLEGLNKLSMRNCESLEFLPDSICNLANLTHLDLSGCSLPEKLGDLISLTYLEVLGSGIKHFPFSVLMRKKLEPFSSSLTRYYSFSCLVHLDLSDCNLLEFSDAIAHLSSLNTLKLCRNNLESLPVTLNQLGCLTHLELEACKRLKSIPELSSSINCIDAHDCTALETVSTPKTRKFDFRFSNCVRLVQANLFRDIVETHSLDQDNHLRPLCFNMCLPGSEIPEWFNLRDMGCSVTFHVPVNSFNNKLLGIAVCIVINFSGARHDVSNICGRCHWTSKGNHGGHFFKFDVLGRQLRTHRFLESDHLFMVYLPWSEYGWIAEDGLDAFKIVVETGTYSPTEDCFTSSCAVRLVYANHEEMQNSVTQPIIHVDSREGEVDGQTMEDAVWQGEGCCAKGGVSRLGAPFFPDQLEIRKSKTELEAESLESGERTGTCQTLELLLAPQTDSKDEEEIMVVAEQGEACRAHLCCCLSLSGCTMSLRNRNKGAISDELGSHSGLVVPNTQSEGEEERVEGGFNNGRGIIDWKRIARVTMQLLLLAGCSIALKQTTLVRMKGKKSS